MLIFLLFTDLKKMNISGIFGQEILLELFDDHFGCGWFIGVDKGSKHHIDSEIGILSSCFLAKMHAGMG